MKKNWQILLLVLALVGTVGVMYWRNSPQERAERFLAELADVVTLKASDNNLVRKARSVKLLRYVQNPAEFSLDSIRVDRKADHDDVSSGFLALALGANDVEMKFSQVAVLSSDSEEMEVSAWLVTESGFRGGRYNVDTTVRLTLVETPDGLRLAKVEEQD